MSCSQWSSQDLEIHCIKVEKFFFVLTIVFYLFLLTMVSRLTESMKFRPRSFKVSGPTIWIFNPNHYHILPAIIKDPSLSKNSFRNAELHICFFFIHLQGEIFLIIIHNSSSSSSSSSSFIFKMSISSTLT